MFVAHAPTGYILTTIVLKYINTDSYRAYYKYIFWWGILASILPDFDLFYFYLVDNRQHSHHSYITHLPIFWVSLMAPILLYGVVTKKAFFCLFSLIGLINLIGHMVLDSVVGKICWLYPFSNTGFHIFNVPNRYDWWVLNFILHWSFLFEISLTIVSFLLIMKRTSYL